MWDRWVFSTPLAHADGSLIEPDGQVLCCSFERFERDIVHGDCCFICGVSPESGAMFNDEHVLPEWILRRCGLFRDEIVLANREERRYGSYKIPCCARCNGRMGEVFENPIRQLFDGGHERVARNIRESGPARIFSWLALIFLKTHLGDQRFDFKLDRRSGDFRKIGDLINYSPLHHVHAVARAFHTGATLEPLVYGSLIVLPSTRDDRVFQRFDYADLYDSRTLLIRIDDVAIIVALDDSCAASHLYRHSLAALNAPLNPIQVREVFANISWISANLRARPRFHSTVGPDGYFIGAVVPPRIELKNPSRPSLGELMVHTLRELIEPMPDASHILALIRDEKYTFLFGPDGKQLPGAACPTA